MQKSLSAIRRQRRIEAGMSPTPKKHSWDGDVCSKCGVVRVYLSNTKAYYRTPEGKRYTLSPECRPKEE